MIRVQELSELYNAYTGIYDKKNLSEEEGALTTCKDGKKRVNCAAADAIYDKKQQSNSSSSSKDDDQTNKGTITKYKDGKPVETQEIDLNKKSNSEIDKFSSISRDDYNKKYGDGNTKVDDTKVNDTKVNDTKVNDTKVNDTKVNDTKVNDTKVNDTKVNDTKVNDTKVNDTKVNDTKVNDTKVNDTKVNDTKVNDTKVNDTKVNDTKVNDTKVKKDYRTDKEKEWDKKPKMSKLERQNRARFGDKAVDHLKQQQIDFKTMQAMSQMPGADRKALKRDFINKYPNSITAQKYYGLRDHVEFDAFDIVLNHLMETNQVDSIDEALYVMVEMDQKIIGEIVKEFNG